MIRTKKPKHTKAYMGVDPGKSGAACLLTEDNNVFFIDWPKDDDIEHVYKTIEQWKASYDISLCILEKVHAMPKQGVSSTFSFGMNYGSWKAIVAISQIPYLLVTPQAWQKGLISQKDGKTPKLRSKAATKRMYPKHKHEFEGVRGGWLDGRADAALMAWVARERA